jgi:dihydrofolate reductase
MSNLIYMAMTSLDGYIEDQDGRFDWAAPDEEVHQFVNDLVRGAGLFLYGRRMYEMMMVWETEPGFAAESPVTQDFAGIWQAADKKIVYSRTLEAAATARTRIERSFDPEAVRRLKAIAGADIAIGGPNLASHAFRAGLVNEVYLFIAPVVVGGGKKALHDQVRLELEMLEERRFANGMVYLHYRTRSG